MDIMLLKAKKTYIFADARVKNKAESDISQINPAVLSVDSVDELKADALNTGRKISGNDVLKSLQSAENTLDTSSALMKLKLLNFKLKRFGMTGSKLKLGELSFV